MDRQIKYFFWRLLGRIFSNRRTDFTKENLDTLRSVLVIRPDRLGDVILSTPIYESIKRSLPKVRTTVLVQSGPAEVLNGNPFIDQIIHFNPKRPWSVFREFDKETFDLAIVLNQMFSGTAATLALLSKAPWRAGYANPEGTGIYNIQIPLPKTVKPEVQHNLDTLRHMEFHSLVEVPHIYFDDEIQTKVDRDLNDMNLHPARPLILVKPGTRLDKWGWRLEKFRHLVQELIRSQVGEVLLICGPGEDELITSIQTNGAPRALPSLGLRELTYLIERADLLICNHTGIMHLASAVKTPVLAIFKHGDAHRWGPYNTSHAILEERLSDALMPQTVIETVKKLLTSTLDRNQQVSRQSTG